MPLQIPDIVSLASAFYGSSVLFAALAYPLNASIPGLIGQSVFGGKDFAAISATLMTAVYVGQALCAPIMSAFLATEGGMKSGWIFWTPYWTNVSMRQ